MCGKGKSSQDSPCWPLSELQRRELAAVPLHPHTRLLSRIFLSDRALQTGTPEWLLRETQVYERTRWLAAVVVVIIFEMWNTPTLNSR